MRRYIAAGILTLSAAMPAWSQTPSTGSDVRPAVWKSKNRFSSEIGPRQLLPPPGTADSSRVIRAANDAPGPLTLPNTHDQIWWEYNISRYTQRHSTESKPEQAIIDWILRETGTELWFSEPLGLLSATRQTLRVYHTREIQELVSEIVERFVRPETESCVFGVRLLTLRSPNWRTKALPRMRPVQVQTPGVEAWLLSHEDAAIVLSDMHKRTDCRDYNSPNELIRNGDTHAIQRTRPVAYVKGVQPFQNGWGGNQMNMGQVDEGFQLRLSPLMATDGAHVDAVIKIESHQVERLKSVAIATPTGQHPRQMSTIKVPQTSSWRLHERFHWPASEVLLVSCGVVASPGPEKQSGVQLPTLNLVPRPPRSDALIFIEAKGRATDLVSTTARQAQGGDLNYRGRY